MKTSRIPGNPSGSKLWRKCPEKKLDDPAFLALVEQRIQERREKRGQSVSVQSGDLQE